MAVEVRWHMSVSYCQMQTQIIMAMWQCHLSYEDSHWETQGTRVKGQRQDEEGARGTKVATHITYWWLPLCLAVSGFVILIK